MSVTAVLLSGGLDSAVLAADEAVRPGNTAIQPIYVSVGLAWEDAERAVLAELLTQPPFQARVRALVSLSVDMRDVYAITHWAVRGRPPSYHTPDEDVYLPGRNVILLGKAGVFCAAAKIDRIVLGTLSHNPFPDATPAFRSAMAGALSLGLGYTLRIDAPYADMGKAAVVARGAALGIPFNLTFSCMNPQGFGIRDSGFVRDSRFVRSSSSSESQIPNPKSPLHCGLCSKCRERHDAFLEAGIADPTEYADDRYVHA